MSYLNPTEIALRLQALGLTPRASQKVMMHAVYDLLSQEAPDRSTGEHLLTVEAPTGTGKSYGYLLPAIGLARAKKMKLVIATAVVSLQEQLLNTDVPACRSLLDLPFSAAIAKGKSRYVCQLRLEDAVHQAQAEKKVIHFYHKLDTKLKERWDGDMDSLEVSAADKKWLPNVQMPKTGCLGETCRHSKTCGYLRAKKRVAEADVILANHNMVLADLSLGGGRILPDPANTIYVFDEAHNLPAKAVEQQAGELHYQHVEDVFKKLLEWMAVLSTISEDLAKDMETYLKPLRASLQKLKQALLINASGAQTTLTWNVVIPWEQELVNIAKLVLDHVTDLETTVNDVWANQAKRLKTEVHKEHGAALTTFILEKLEDWRVCLEAFVAPVDVRRTPTARWIDQFNKDAQPAIKSSPVMATDILPRLLYGRAAFVIHTSATLSSLGTLNLFKFKTGLHKYPNATAMQLPGVFDYTKGELFLPMVDTAPDVNSPAYPLWMAKEMQRLLSVYKGKGWLVLFTSKKRMEDTRDILRQAKVPVLCQYERPTAVLLTEHKRKVDNGEVSFLFGVASFSEGLDLPGAYCERVVLTQIPFRVFTHPVDATLDAWLKQQKRSSFREVSLPEASSTLIQEAGRLLRKESDSGYIFLLDPRFKAKWNEYGKTLLQSLPPYKKGVPKK